MTSTELPLPSSIPTHVLDALSVDALLPICVACGTQYPRPVSQCPICEDPRQAVPLSGQAWTTLADLSSGGGSTVARRNTILQDSEDGRVEFIQTEPAFGINQTPILLHTAQGSYIWDCSAFLSTALAVYLLQPERRLKGIAISHPHFFTTSLTWSRALQVPLYLNELDKEWYQRLNDITDDDQVVWWRNEHELGPGVRVIECGGHFSGSSVLHWDRLLEPAPSPSHLPTRRTPVSGLLLTADTIMVQPHRRGFTFVWSVPNMVRYQALHHGFALCAHTQVPLDPLSTLRILERLRNVPFGAASSTWPGRMIYEGAKDALYESVRAHLGAMGWKWELGEDLVPLSDGEEIHKLRSIRVVRGVERDDAGGAGHDVADDAQNPASLGNSVEEEQAESLDPDPARSGESGPREVLPSELGCGESRGPGVVLSSLRP